MHGIRTRGEHVSEKQRRARLPMEGRIRELHRLEVQGVLERQQQAEAMRVSLPQVDRIRRAARERRATRRMATIRTDSRATQELFPQLGVRIAAPLLKQLKEFSRRWGATLTLTVAVALSEWLNKRGWPAEHGLPMTLGQLVNLDEVRPPKSRR